MDLRVPFPCPCPLQLRSVSCANNASLIAFLHDELPLPCQISSISIDSLEPYPYALLQKKGITLVQMPRKTSAMPALAWPLAKEMKPK